MINNPVIKILNLDTYERPVPKIPIVKKSKKFVMPRSIPVTDEETSEIDMVDDIPIEQRAQTIETVNRELEDELEMKLLILANEDEYSEKISNLIGPVFSDITLSEDQEDPITFDQIWEYVDGKKIPSKINKYYLFSYHDSKNKIRCMTIFSIYNMLQTENYLHPSTLEEIPQKDIDRAKELIELYSEKINLFTNSSEHEMTPEYAMKNKIGKLFKKFHIHSIYFEDKWLLAVDNKSDLYKIITETRKLVTNNVKTINPSLKNLDLFKNKESRNDDITDLKNVHH